MAPLPAASLGNFQSERKPNKGEITEVKEAFHKWANGGNTLVAYGPRDEGGYSLLEYNGAKPKELFLSGSLEEVQRAFRDYYAVKDQFEKGMPWKAAGNISWSAAKLPTENSRCENTIRLKNRIEMPLERCETLEGAERALARYAELAGKMKEFNSLTERQQHFERALREARKLRPGFDRASGVRHRDIGKTVEIGR